MLIVYGYTVPKPDNAIDVSSEPLETLVDAVCSIFSHHKTAVIWFGYLEGWMLTPAEEVRLRKVIRKFECHVLSCHPLSFSQAWKNEMTDVYLAPPG
jgi:hypothetical protein